jgi:hypothetical protein
MGHIKKVLAMGSIDPRIITARGIWADLCENIHLHYRDIRLEFSELEWAHFRAAINQLGKGVEHVAVDKDYREGDPNTLIQVMYNVPLNPNSDYFPNRVTVELQRDNTIHFHWRNMRLHWPIQDFKKLAQLFMEADAQLEKLEFEGDTFPGKHVQTGSQRMTVPIDSVQPYDPGHLPMNMDEEHRKGIEYVKQLIKEGNKIRPILVNPEGQRLDGFKRYMAAYELGHKEIEVIVDPFGEMGGQTNMSMLDDSELDKEVA